MTLLLLLSFITFITSAMEPHIAAPVNRCYSCIPFDRAPLAIARSKLFKACLDGRDQKTPGRLFIETHEHIPSLTDWTDEHWTEFGRFSKALQRAVHKAFDPHETNKLINIECKMNLAREEGTHTHFHLLPRYRLPIGLYNPETERGEAFEDTFYGKPYDFDAKNYRKLNVPFLYSIIQRIQKELNLQDVPEGCIRQLNKNIIFDIGGVILKGDTQTIIAQMAKENPSDVQLQQIPSSDTWKLWLRGKKDQKQVIKELAVLYHKESVKTLLARYLNPARGFDQGTVAIAMHLKRHGHRLFLLSNFTKEAQEIFINNNPKIFEHFDGALLSSDVGFIKPEPEIYQSLLDRWKLHANECVFIDDTEKNVQAAQELGIDSYVYKTHGLLIDQLKKRGVQI